MSKYDALRDHLQRQTSHEFTMQIDEIDDLVSLPASARVYTAWWANENPDSTSHVQCESWLAAGFRAEPQLSRHLITFTELR